MEDLKLDRAYFDFDEDALLKQLENESVKHVASAFMDNMDQVRSVTVGFLSLMSIVTRYESNAVEACHEIMGKFHPEDQELRKPENKKRIDTVMHAKVDAYEKEINADESKARREDERLLKNIKFVLELYGQNDPENEHIRHIRNMYKSMIVGSWTAFEVMAADLWEQALNQHPVILASLSSYTGEMEKKLEFWLLEKHAYDLSKVMGTIHRSEGRFNFRTLDGTRAAYLGAFRRDPEQIERAICNSSLDALSKMRHVIVHNGAKVDSRFRGEGAKIPGLKKWIQLPEGTAINLDGQETIELIFPAFGAGIALLKAVDEWLKSHQ